MTHRLHILATFSAATIGMLMAGCSSDIFTEEPDQEVGLSSVVAFTLTEAHGLSRGVPIDSVHQIKDFRADAYLQRNDNFMPFFYNDRQRQVSAAGVYHAQHAYLWPSETGDMMSFLAVAPYDAVAGITISEHGDFSFTVADSVVSQCDLMFAKVSNVACPAPGTFGRQPVPLTFQHILTQVRFVFGANLANYWRGLTIHSVRVENVATSGTWHADTGKWDNLDAPTHSYQITSTSDGAGNGKKPYTDEETNIWNKEYSMFLMPQTLPTGARVVVDMSYVSHSGTFDNDPNESERATYYLYLDGKKLEPGHTVIVEINSNYTFDGRVVNTDGTDVDIRPLSPEAQELPLRVVGNRGAGGYRIRVAPECQSYATVSNADYASASPDSVCDFSTYFTLHVAANTSPDDRFIRLIFADTHNSGDHLADHVVVFKQRGFSGSGDNDDTPAYEDQLMPWGFNWPQPFKVYFTYDIDFIRDLDYQIVQRYIPQWSSTGTDNITFDFDILRSLARQPNSDTDGLANTRAINTSCYFLRPFDCVNFFMNGIFSADGLMVNDATLDDGSVFKSSYGHFNDCAVLEALSLNNTQDLDGQNDSQNLSDANLQIYLPAIEELKALAVSDTSPLLPGRTYWSSTVNASGEPVALTINDDGSFTVSTPGPDTQAWVHPVRVSQ